MLYSIRFFSDNFRASSVRNRSASLQFPPYGENRRELKEPCSTSIFRRLQCHFSSFSLLAKAFAKGLKTLTSKNARCPLCQKPSALISKRALSKEKALPVKTSPVKVWIEGVAQPQHYGIRPWEGMWTGLALRHASYGQIRLSCPALHDRRRISYRPRTNWWGVLQCPAHLSTTFRVNSVLCGFVALWLCGSVWLWWA